jgi:hypothetical protein
MHTYVLAYLYPLTHLPAYTYDYSILVNNGGQNDRSHPIFRDCIFDTLRLEPSGLLLIIFFSFLFLFQSWPSPCILLKGHRFFNRT